MEHQYSPQLMYDQDPEEFNKLQSPGNLSENAHQLLEQMGSENEMEVLQAVMQFSMHLAVAPEEAFGSLPVDQAVSRLVECLENPLPDVSLYAIISLNHILDSVPNSAGVLACSGGIGSLCLKLMNFDYIDMAEHTITALERLSYEHSTAILKEGVFSVLLSTMDFFEANTQKRILKTVIILARSLQSLELMLEYIVPVLPVVSSLLQYRGPEFLPSNLSGVQFYQELVESIWRLCGNESSVVRGHIEIVAQEGLLQNLVGLLSYSDDLKLAVFRLLRSLCRGSPHIILQCYELGVTGLVKEALDQKEDQPAFFVEALHLIHAMVPRHQSDSQSDVELARLYKEDPQLLRSLGEMVLPRILHLYERIVNKTVRTLVLQIMGEILAASEQDLVASYTANPNFSTFLSELLSYRDSEAVKSALSIVLVLLSKIPAEIAVNFLREGIVDKVKVLQDMAKVKELSFPPLKPRDVLNANPNNIRQLLSQSGIPSDSPLIEHIIRQIQRRRGRRPSGEEEEDSPDLPQFTRAQSVPASIPDAHTQAAEEIVGLAEMADRKYREHHRPTAGNTLQALRDLANVLLADRSDGDSELLRRVTEAITAEDGVSLHELSNSGLLDALWKWITFGPKRVYEFLRVFMTQGKGGHSFFEVLIGLVVKCVRYTQQFTVLIYETPDPALFFGMKTLATPIKFVLEYDPEPFNAAGMPAELEAKHVLFTEVPKMTITTEQYQTLDTVYEGLLKANNPESVNLFAASFQRTNAEMRGVNHGQLNMTRQHLKMQSMLSDSIDLVSALAEMGIRSEGNEQLLQEIQAQRQQMAIEKVLQEAEKDEDEDENIDDINKPIQAMQFSLRKESALEISSLKPVLSLNSSRLHSRMSLFEVANKHGKGMNPPLHLKFHFEVKQEILEESSRFLSGPDLFQYMADTSVRVPVEKTDPVYKPLRLLKLLHCINAQLPLLLAPGTVYFQFPVSPVSYQALQTSLFINHKLSALLSKQLSDMLTMVGGMSPDWIRTLTKHSPFLFSFPLRAQLFRATAFANGRALHYYSENGKKFSVRMLRQKAMVPREEVLEAAMRVLSDSALLKFGILEFDFCGEEGTGIGPTLEFYALVSKEIRKIGIWRNSGETVGLFPAPIQSQDPEQVSSLFSFVGKLVAKALYDNRMVDLPFSVVFWKLLLRRPVSLFDVLQVDLDLGKHLLEMQELVNKYNWVMSHSDERQREKQISQLTLKGAQVTDLHLFFTLPGYDIELKPNGKNVLVTLENLEEYVNLVTEYTLLQHFQADTFRKGFEKLIPIESFECFELDEIELIICGKTNEDWDIGLLREHIVPDHGYTKDSQVFEDLLHVMSQFSDDERRHFLQFATGSPRLPVDGFKGLSPQLTVVRKPPEASRSPDEYLPSVMTCQNYLKLPEYSSCEMLERQLKYAIMNAYESFHLS